MILVFHLKGHDDDMLQIEGNFAELWSDQDNNKKKWIVSANDGGQDEIDATRWELDEICELKS